jgi:phospholipid/cholesterol/gamma-HCH transport system permease protein
VLRPRPYHPAMVPTRTWQAVLGEVGRGAGRAGARWSVSWWQVLHTGALLGVLALSPSSYERENRAALARHLYLGTVPVLPWFVALTTLISLVLIRIVVVTALSYGLSQYALQLVVRVLVLELIPLGAALFVAMRCTLPSATELTRLRARGGFEAMQRAGIDPIRRELLPRVVAGSFAVVMLALVSCLLAMALTYLSVYGFRTSAFAGFTRTLGQIFNPGVALIFVLKTLFFSLAVALIPVAAALRGAGTETSPSASPSAGTSTSAELHSLVRLFSVILLIEVASLMGNYH